MVPPTPGRPPGFHVCPMRSIYQALLDSPPLLADLPEAKTFDRQHLQLPGWLPPLNLQQKLGHLYEEALTTLLSSSHTIDLLARNLQIQASLQSTLGELDFLLQDQVTGEFIHLELATKFYLTVPTSEGLTYPGPDARDHYLRKLKRLRSHQLVLTQKHRALLPPEYQKRDFIPQHLVLGCLFDPLHLAAQGHPPQLSPVARRGKWLPQSLFQERFPHETSPHLIPKHLWPCPLSTLREIPLEPFDPEEPLTRCTLLLLDHCSQPVFLTPEAYPVIRSL